MSDNGPNPCLKATTPSNCERKISLYYYNVKNGKCQTYYSCGGTIEFSS